METDQNLNGVRYASWKIEEWVAVMVSKRVKVCTSSIYSGVYRSSVLVFCYKLHYLQKTQNQQNENEN